MKAKVIVSFIDKYTDHVYNIGDVIKCTEERYEEIESVGHFIEKVTYETKTEGKLKEHGNETTDI